MADRHHPYLIQALTADETAGLTEAFGALPELLARGGPLGHIRFAPELLTRVLDEVSERGVTMDDEEWYATALFRACAPSLGTPTLVHDLIRDASALVTRGHLSRRQTEAAGIAALATALVSPDDYATMPALEVVFKVQLGEREEGLDSLYSALAAKMGEARSSGLSPTASLDRVLREEPDLVEQFSKSSLLRGFVACEAEKATARVERLIEEGRLPPMLTVAEVVRITTSLVLWDARHSANDAHTDRPPLREVFDAMAPAITDRLVGLVQDKQVPKEVRDQYLDLVQALVTMPERCILGAFRQAGTTPPLYRHEREIELARRFTLAGLRDPCVFDELRGCMDGLGDAHAVTLLDQARADIEAVNDLRTSVRENPDPA